MYVDLRVFSIGKEIFEKISGCKLTFWQGLIITVSRTFHLSNVLLIPKTEVVVESICL